MVSLPQTLSNEETSQAIELLMTHKKTLIQDLLDERGLAYSGSKADIRYRVLHYLEDNSITEVDIVDWLYQLEGWGRQVIYLYQANPEYSDGWLSIEDAHATIKKRAPQHIGLLNNPKLLTLPDESELAYIIWKPDNLRFVWVEKREIRERYTEADFTERFDNSVATDSNVVEQRESNPDNIQVDANSALLQNTFITYKAWKVTYKRALIVFDWNLIDGSAMLMIRAMGESNYKKLKSDFEAKLNPIIGIRGFSPVILSSSIRRIHENENIRPHSLKSRTNLGTQIEIVSADDQNSFRDDDVAMRADNIIKNDTTGLVGDFYWSTNENLSEEVHTKIYAHAVNNQYISVAGQHREQDIRYVLSRIRNFC